MTHDISNSATLSPNKYSALISWEFNVGCSYAGSSTLIKRLNNDEDPNTVVSLELTNWNKGSNRVLPGLTRRRAAKEK